MKRINLAFIRILIFYTFIFSAGSLQAASGDFGAGFILGDPTGLTGKYFLTTEDAVDFGIGATYHDGFYLYADYLRHFHELFPVNELVLYVGAGGGFHRHDRDNHRAHHKDEYSSLECRVPVGIEYVFAKAPLGIFLEIAPALQIIPHIDSDIRGGLGLRYYF